MLKSHCSTCFSTVWVANHTQSLVWISTMHIIVLFNEAPALSQHWSGVCECVAIPVRSVVHTYYIVCLVCLLLFLLMPTFPPVVCIIISVFVVGTLVLATQSSNEDKGCLLVWHRKGKGPPYVRISWFGTALCIL